MNKEINLEEQKNWRTILKIGMVIFLQQDLKSKCTG